MHWIIVAGFTVASCAPTARPPLGETSGANPSAHATVPVSDRATAAPIASATAPVEHDTAYPPTAAIDARAWASAHGAKWPPAASHAPAVREPIRAWDLSDHVGVPLAPGLLIEARDADGTTNATVLRLDGGELRAVWTGPVATHGWLELTVRLSTDGAALTVEDVSPHACDCALDEYEQKQASGIDPGFGAVLRAGCKSRGTFPWTGTVYARSAAVSGLGHCPSAHPDESWATSVMSASASADRSGP